MKKQLGISLVIFALLMTVNAFGQGFVESVESESMQFFANKECILKLVSGEEVHGKFYNGTFINKGFSKVTIKLENGEKVKYEAEQIVSIC
jgi:small nuclear ribonucleoprotein (snRNP)-like protein